MTWRKMTRQCLTRQATSIRERARKGKYSFFFFFSLSLRPFWQTPLGTYGAPNMFRCLPHHLVLMTTGQCTHKQLRFGHAAERWTHLTEATHPPDSAPSDLSPRHEARACKTTPGVFVHLEGHLELRRAEDKGIAYVAKNCKRLLTRRMEAEWRASLAAILPWTEAAGRDGLMGAGRTQAACNVKTRNCVIKPDTHTASTPAPWPTSDFPLCQPHVPAFLFGGEPRHCTKPWSGPRIHNPLPSPPK